MSQTYDAAFIEKSGEAGLTRDDILMLLSRLNEDEVYPVEIENSIQESCAMGFITAEAANKVDFIYDNTSALAYELRKIMSDVNNEHDNDSYAIAGLNVLLTR